MRSAVLSCIVMLGYLLGMQELRLGDRSVDLASGTICSRFGPVRLTASELRLLGYLAARPGRPVSRTELLRTVWGHPSADTRTNTVGMTVYRLRRKLEPDPRRPVWIQTVRGRGWRFVAPPPGAAAGPRTQPAPAALVGRRADVERLRSALLHGARWVTVTGPVGIGKSTVARTLLAEIAAAGRAPVRYVAARGRGRVALQPAGGVILLDDADTLTAGALAGLSRALQTTPGLSVIATSRRRLGIEGEQVVVLGPLAPTSTVSLLRRRITALGVEAVPPELAALAGETHGVPLLVELVARAVAVDPGDPASIDPMSVVNERPGAPRAHRCWSDAVQDALSSLTAEERGVLAVASVFAGPFEPSVAAEIGGVQAGVMDQVLQVAIGRSLATRTPDGRIALAPGHRGILLASLPPDRRATLRGAHVRWLARLCREVSREQQVPELGRLRGELIEALRHGISAETQPGDAEVVARQAHNVVEAVGPIGALPGWIAEALERPLQDRTRLVLIALLSRTCGLVGDPQGSARHLEQGVALAEQLRDDETRLNLLNQRVALATEAGRLEEGVRLGQEAVALAERLGGGDRLYLALEHLAAAHTAADAPEAAPLHRRAADLAHALGKPIKAAIAVANWANLLPRGSAERRAAYAEALALSAGRYPRFEAVLRGNMAIEQLDCGDLERAARSFEEAESALRAVGDRVTLYRFEVRRSELDVRLGRRRRAISRLEGALGVLDDAMHVDARRARCYLGLLTGDPARLTGEGRDTIEVAAWALASGLEPPDDAHPDVIEALSLMLAAGPGCRALRPGR